MRTFGEVFTAFGGPAKLAEAIDIPPFHAQTMKTRNAIPAAYFRRVATAARERGGELAWITVEELAAMAEAKADEAKAKRVESPPSAPSDAEPSEAKQ